MNNVGFYPTTQLNPYTTTIGSQGNFQSLMSYIYSAGVYETINSDSVTSTIYSLELEYSGFTLEFTPLNSTNIMILYNIYSGNNNATVGFTMGLYIDDNPPPAIGSMPPVSAIEIDSGELALGFFRSQILVINNGIVYGGNNSGASCPLTINTKYYISWYLVSTTNGSLASLQLLGMSVQSI